MSLAKKIVLVALTIHLISLLFQYQDVATTGGPIPMTWADGSTQYYYNSTKEKTGIELRPFAGIVIIGLMGIFLTRLSKHPFWVKYGYWATLVILILTAFGGAIIRTTGGKMSLVSLGLVILAAIVNGRELKQAKATV
jgi:hypothetical protein